MTPQSPAGHPADAVDNAEGYHVEDEVLAAARARGIELGCAPVDVATGTLLRFLATASRARTVVEIGTGAGVSGLYLLRGMVPDGVLTSIDVEPEHQAAARRAFGQAGVASGRTRLIMGRAADVLPRLTDEAYDLLFVDAGPAEYPTYHEQGVRLLRPGGVIVFADVLRTAPAGNTGEVVRAIREDERLVPVMLPVGDGLLIAAKAVPTAP